MVTHPRAECQRQFGDGFRASCVVDRLDNSCRILRGPTGPLRTALYCARLVAGPALRLARFLAKLRRALYLASLGTGLGPGGLRSLSGLTL